MKKVLLGLVAAVAVSAPAVMAQETEYLDVWKRNKGITLSYVTHQSMKMTDSPLPFQYDSDWGVSLSTGTTYLWPRSAGWAGNRIKVGVDARWFDISYVKYKKYPKINGVQVDESWYVDEYDYDYDYDYEDEDGDVNLGSHQLHMGVGVGPAVAVVPFSNADNALRFLRFNLYGHFNPSASALLYDDEKGDSHASWAFVAAWDFGFNVQWKNFALGFEGRWGSAKYKSLISEDEDEWDYDLENGNVSYNGGKQTLKNASFRICLGFRF